MFKCKSCGSTEFELMLQPGFKGDVSIKCNDHDDVMIRVNDKEFMADMLFMNQFAVCPCGTIGQWDYFYPNVPTATISSDN